ncbi:MAG: transglutaminase-like domain-containing protein [Planctomycetota bacterium]
MRPLLIAAAACGACAAFGQAERAGPFLTRDEPVDWMLTATVSLTPATEVKSRRQRSRPNLSQPQTEDINASERFSIEQATVFWPVAGSAASYEVDRGSVKGTVTLGSRDTGARFAMLDTLSGGAPLHSGAAYAQWTLGPIERAPAAGVLTVTQRIRAWRTVFDEEAAKEVSWPTGEWPKEAASSLEPMLFIDEGFEGPYTKSRVADLVDRFTRGNPRSQPPAVTAKWIAGEVIKSFRVSGQAAVSDIVRATGRQSGRSVGAIGAINTVGAAQASQSRRGSPIDLALLLTACYREAGLPARVVIGYVVEPADRGEDALQRAERQDRAEEGLYAWVEFALYDERESRPDRALTWVPVDVLAMQRNNVARRPFDQPWDGFGTCEQFNEILPIGYHLHPHRLAASAYGVSQRREPLPGLWGWNVVPVTPQAIRQAITLSATSASQTSNRNTPRDR